jgi:hypothetical protein
MSEKGRRFADFVIGGTEKAGTTSVFDYLSAHPQVCASSKKETDFFLEAHLVLFSFFFRGNSALCDYSFLPPALSSPNSALITSFRRVSIRASMSAVLVVTLQPPRVMTGSSTMVQARSAVGAASLSRTTAAGPEPYRALLRDPRGVAFAGTVRKR